uniref:Uncharacterized protein n=1 Tax=Oryza glumipatula TaxID=40148 RepID=A0A0E0ARP3_9ORYZ
MDVCQLISLYMELWDDDDMPAGMLRRVIRQLGMASAAVAVAALQGAQGRRRCRAGSSGAGGAVLLPALASFVLLLHGVAMVLLSVCGVRAAARGPGDGARRRRCRLARAVARASLTPFLLLVLAGLLQGDGEEADCCYST